MGKYMIIKKTEYEKMKKSISTSGDNYIYLFNTTNNEIEKMKDVISKLNDSIKITLEKLNLVEMARRKNAGKVGALTTNYNREKKKTKELINTIDSQKKHYENTVAELEDVTKLQELELDKKDMQIKILKNNGKQKQIEDYHKLSELQKDIEKHRKKVN